MDTTRAKIIVNPVSAGGRVGKEWPQLQATLLQGGLQFDAELTQYPLHAVEIARQALDQGYRYFVAVGGDGTVNEVVNGLVVQGHIPAEAMLSIIPGGTGCDYIRILGISRNAAEACQTTLGHRTRRMDIGEIQCMRDGQPTTRYFVNVAGLGFDGEVCARVNRGSKRIGGTLPYLTNLVINLFAYRNKDVQITFDGESIQGRFNSVIVCNGQYFGGGMWIGPQAVPDDGIFDLVLVGDTGRLEFLLTVPRLYKGTHLTHPKIRALQVHQVRVESRQPMYIQAEGELVGEAPATFRILPGALNLRV